MRDEDLLQCPLLQALDGMRRAELLGLMKDSNLREKVEKCVAGQPRTALVAAEPVSAGTNPRPARDFQEDVHSWNRDVPLWRRSAKE